MIIEQATVIYHQEKEFHLAIRDQQLILEDWDGVFIDKSNLGLDYMQSMDLAVRWEKLIRGDEKRMNSIDQLRLFHLIYAIML